jgi:hypothetical protein
VNGFCKLAASEPTIHIVADDQRPQAREAAENYRQAQFQAIDMLTGRMAPWRETGLPEYSRDQFLL